MMLKTCLSSEHVCIQLLHFSQAWSASSKNCAIWSHRHNGCLSTLVYTFASLRKKIKKIWFLATDWIRSKELVRTNKFTCNAKNWRNIKCDTRTWSYLFLNSHTWWLLVCVCLHTHSSWLCFLVLQYITSYINLYDYQYKWHKVGTFYFVNICIFVSIYILCTHLSIYI